MKAFPRRKPNMTEQQIKAAAGDLFFAEGKVLDEIHRRFPDANDKAVDKILAALMSIVNKVQPGGRA